MVGYPVRVMVAGGGMAEMQAALDLANLSRLGSQCPWEMKISEMLRGGQVEGF